MGRRPWGGVLPLAEVNKARLEEISFMEKRGMWDLRPITECYAKTGKAPMSVRWVDTNKGDRIKMLIRSRLVARDFRGMDKGRDDLFAATPPLEAKRMLFSRAATKRYDGRWRKLMFIDVKKAHLYPECDDEVYIELPPEANAPPGMCGKLRYWMYGCRKAGNRWESNYAGKLEGVGFKRGMSCGVVFYHPTRDIALVVHGDDFTFCGLEEDLRWIEGLMRGWYEIVVRGMVGGDATDDKEVVILGRIVRYTESGIEYEADPRHRQAILDHFGFEEGSRVLGVNGDKGTKIEDWEEEELDKEEAKVFRGMAARFNYLSLDCPDLQFPSKRGSKDMAKPKRGSWQGIKKLARYLVGRKSVVLKYGWQEEEPTESEVSADSDWGGDVNDRRSTSGGMWMMGKHCIKTWSSTQGAYALSSAEAELYGMIEGVTRGKGLLTLAGELGFNNLTNVITLGTDSSAAKSFVCRRGLGRMRHLEIRDLWLQKEVLEGKVKVVKLKGTENPADLMTKVLSIKEIDSRLAGMGLRAEWVGGNVGKV